MNNCNQDTLISVIIPVYCAQKTLRQCLDSVLSQSLTSLEVICVDDGSTDESLHILEEYAARDPRVTVLTQKNQYAGIARNKGLDAAKGTYVAFLDADDYFLPDCLLPLYRQAERFHLDMIKASFQYLDVQTAACYKTLYSVNSSISPVWRKRVFNFSRIPARLLNVSDVPWNGLYRKAFLDVHRIRFNHLRCINDHSFYIACLLHAERIMVSSKYMTCYRVEQKDSLVGKKANHFDNQLQSYAIVQSLCREAKSPFAKQIMAQELHSLFAWYHKLKNQAADPTQLEKQLQTFLAEIDEEDIGQDFLRNFPFSKDYYALRYGTEAPPRPNVLFRTLQCWREHGFAYTLARLLKKRT